MRTKPISKEKIDRMMRQKFVQISPGRVVPAMKGEQMPGYHLALLVPENGGESYRTVLVRHNLVPLTMFLKATGLQSLRTTMLRLGRAGEIEIIPAAPRVNLLNVDSWMQHLSRCSENSETYWTRDRMRNYLRAL